MAIQSPPAWIWDRLNLAGRSVGSADPEEYWSGPGDHSAGVGIVDGALPVRRIGVGDVIDALIQGHEDFRAARTDVIFLCFLYPILGFVLAWLARGHQLLPLLFPLASGFALVGPLAAVGLNEMSRRRELGAEVNWTDAFGVLRAPSIGTIAMLGTILVVIFLAWLAVANALYLVTLGPEPPASLAAFVHDVFHTGAGWVMIIAGIAIGFVFALLVLSISVVSFPLLLDRKAGLGTAIRTSIRAVRLNPGPMAVWGLIIAAGLVLGSIPLFLGLVIVLPVLGHATWHLYRKVVPSID
jgi:uncharacterized membrane protein